MRAAVDRARRPVRRLQPGAARAAPEPGQRDRALTRARRASTARRAALAVPSGPRTARGDRAAGAPGPGRARSRSAPPARSGRRRRARGRSDGAPSSARRRRRRWARPATARRRRRARVPRGRGRADGDPPAGAAPSSAASAAMITEWARAWRAPRRATGPRRSGPGQLAGQEGGEGTGARAAVGLGGEQRPAIGRAGRRGRGGRPAATRRRPRAASPPPTGTLVADGGEGLLARPVLVAHPTSRS